MHQQINATRLDELNTIQYQKLTKWCIHKNYDTNSLGIGHLIEFLGSDWVNMVYYPEINTSHDHDNLEGSIERTQPSKDLLDNLWEEVKKNI